MRLKSRIERAASQAREMADRETAGRLDDQERAARIEALFQAGRLARDSSGSFYAPDPEMARLAEILELARGRQMAHQAGRP